MFRATENPQIDVFRSIENHISDRKAKLLDAPDQWHNVFCRQVTNRIDEGLFSVLFKEGGRPNSSLKCLVAMMILKEGQGWSDRQLFMECRFNLMVMRSLGLYHIDDDVPVESTYYEFRARLSNHYRRTGADLINESFQGVVQGQIETYGINGEKIRLDSKSIQSNIAKGGRLELILETLRVFLKTVDMGTLVGELSEDALTLLRALREKTVSNIVYPLSPAEKQELLTSLGPTIRQLLARTGQNGLLRRVYEDHYKEVHDPKEETRNGRPKDDGPAQGRAPGTVLRKNREIRSDSLQSAHDPEAAYRSKGQGRTIKQVTGYHGNITETCCEENAFNLIEQIDVRPANISEDAFLRPAIAQSENVLNQKVNHVTTDGGYDGISNREILALDDGLHWNMAKNKGAELRYEFGHDDKGQIRAYCKKTEYWCGVSYSEKKRTSSALPIKMAPKDILRNSRSNAI